MRLNGSLPRTFQARQYKASIEELAATNMEDLQRKEVLKVRQVWRLGSKVTFTVTPPDHPELNNDYQVPVGMAGGRQLRIASRKLEIMREVMAARRIPLYECELRELVDTKLRSMDCFDGDFIRPDTDDETYRSVDPASIALPASPSLEEQIMRNTTLLLSRIAQSTSILDSQIEAGRRGQDACILHAKLAQKQFETLPALVGECNYFLKHRLAECTADCTEALGQSFLASKALRISKEKVLDPPEQACLDEWEDSVETFQKSIDHLETLLGRWAEQLEKARYDTISTVARTDKAIHEEAVVTLYRLTETASITHYDCIREDYDREDIAMTMYELCSAETDISHRARLEELHKAMVDAMDGTYTRRNTSAERTQRKMLEARQQWDKSFILTRNKRFLAWRQALGASIRATLEFEIAGKAFSEHMYSAMKATSIGDHSNIDTSSLAIPKRFVGSPVDSAYWSVSSKPASRADSLC